jgi:TetR/AcrR family transcriptional regulator, transcriptional repressor for nem operon
MLIQGRKKTVKKGDLTRQRVIASAATIFNQRGFEGASMLDVMEATGLEKGGLYRHFSSKEELAAEAFRYSLKQATKTRTDGLDHVQGVIPKLEFLIHRFGNTPSSLPGGCPLLNTAVDSDDGNPVLRKLARRAFASWKKRLSRLIAQGIKAGEIRRHTDPDQLANTIIASLEGALVLSRIEGSREPLKDVQSSLTRLIKTIATRRN